jgi:tRNA(Ile)-lysidine synthase
MTRRAVPRAAGRAFAALLRTRRGGVCGVDVLAAVPEGERILVAVSGGADSTALAMALCAAGRRIVVAHVHHHLRPRTAWRDAAAAEALAARLGVPFCRLDVRPAEAARKTGESVEMAARRLRLDALAGAARRRGIRFVATAHHADDQAETVLLRVLKGTSVHGLAGIPALREDAERCVTWIRPLLGATRAEIESALRAEGIPWREDPTNAEDFALRNRIRHELLPLVEKRINPAAREALLRLAEIARTDDGCLAALAAGGAAAELSGHEAVRRRLAQRELPPRATHGEIAEAAARAGKRAAAGAAPEGLRPWAVERLPEGDGCFRAARGFTRGGEAVCLSAAAVAGKTIRVRRWRAGDKMAPLGMAGHKKLSDIFTDLKVPAKERRRCAVVTVDGEIAALAGWRVAREFAVESPDALALWWRRDARG